MVRLFFLAAFALASMSIPQYSLAYDFGEKGLIDRDLEFLGGMQRLAYQDREAAEKLAAEAGGLELDVSLAGSEGVWQFEETVGERYAATEANEDEDVPIAPSIVVITDEGLSEPDLEVSLGGTVIWTNSASEYVVIFFAEGEAIKLVLAAPSRFYMAADDTFSSGVIPPGGTASLCLGQPGEYRYFSVNGGTGQTFEGMLTVK